MCSACTQLTLDRVAAASEHFRQNGTRSLRAGANSIRIVGHEIQNAAWFRNAGLARKMGYQFKNKISDTQL